MSIAIMDTKEVENAEHIGSEAGFGCLETALGNLPVKALDVDARIHGLVFEVTMRQTYRNAFGKALEATYIFPLPDRAAVGDFKMIVGGRVIDGALKERGQARREYQQAIEQGHRASIVEEERPDTFTMRVGNIEPGEEVTVEFKLTGPLVFADGEATFRFPLVVAPRYIPGNPLAGGNVGDGTATDTDAVPDASRITPPVLLPNFPNPIRLSIAAELVEAGMAYRNVRSSLHAITLAKEGGTHRVEIRPGERVDRDFILRFDIAEEDIQTGASFVRDADGKQGTFAVTMVPPAAPSGESHPRDIVFVLDRSGSMGGWKMVAARRALGRMLDTLTPKDRFQVLAFDNTVESMEPGLLDGTNRNRYRAIEYLSKVEARGGTEMAQPIFQALDSLSGGYQDRRRMVVLVTDGQVGNEQQIVSGVAKRQKNVRMFTVGIDQAVNAGFLNRLADIGGGRCELVESEDRLDEAMDRIHRNIDTPVLTELSVALEGATIVRDSITPTRPPDLFAGAPLQIFGRFEGASPVVKLTAQNRDGSPFAASVRATEIADRSITRVWARQRVRSMEDEYAKRSDGDLAKEITALSLQFGVLCRFTSWVAVDREAKIETSGDVRQIVQPVESPAGWGPGQPAYSQAAYSQAGAMPMAAPMAPRMGSAAQPGSASFGSAGGGGVSRFSPAPPSSKELYEEEVAESFDGFAADDALPSEPAQRSWESPAPVHKARKKGGDRSEGQTRTGQTSPGGDVAYASPEMVRGDGTTAASDVWTLGVILFELLTGKRLFDGAGEVAIISLILGWDRARLGRELSAGSDWHEVLYRALAPTVAERYGDATEMLEDMKSRFGTDAMFRDITLRGQGTGHVALRRIVGQLPPDDALVVGSWLVSRVAHFAETEGRPPGSFTPDTLVVDEHGRCSRSDDHGLVDRLKRWMGLDGGAADREDFWK